MIVIDGAAVGCSVEEADCTEHSSNPAFLRQHLRPVLERLISRTTDTTDNQLIGWKHPTPLLRQHLRVGEAEHWETIVRANGRGA